MLNKRKRLNARHSRCRLSVWLVWFALTVSSAWAGIDVYEFDDEVTRQRYLSFVEEMRCPKCQNQNLEGSDSPIAADLRRELYRMLQEGKSDKEIVDFMVNRYGDYVLYRPQLKRNTLLLWSLPAVLLLLGAVMVGLTLRHRRKSKAQGEESLNPLEQERLNQLLSDAEQKRSQASDKNSPE
ncbi:cytochrome c-type biogenesis protein CcmH [Aestuariicella sp. G3-2]|uniref:cytochrome c-type biogenesis protein n=1 Tax=Pseudomaricurvus albidus TaxID=2842452 RepID=UPI001C0C1735|nr:cytochrome c-type biogenesis protein [Aestuariicella albida]MBU3069979.1 cytochrome c-type biogenesis protein CcmH [Aestuariicella albida]